MTRSLLRPTALGQLLLWLLLPPLPVPRVEARKSRPSLPCPAACEPTRCPPLPTCSAGATPVLDRCRCCRVCAAAEGEACGGTLGRRCAPGLQCRAPLSAQRFRGAWMGTCGCPAAGAAVCGSDGRTYPNLCALRAENRAARLRGALPAVPVLKGDCADQGERRPARAWALATPLSGAPHSGLAAGSSLRLCLRIQLLVPNFLSFLGVSLPVPMWFLPTCLPRPVKHRVPLSLSLSLFFFFFPHPGWDDSWFPQGVSLRDGREHKGEPEERKGRERELEEERDREFGDRTPDAVRQRDAHRPQAWSISSQGPGV